MLAALQEEGLNHIISIMSLKSTLGHMLCGFLTCKGFRPLHAGGRVC